MENPFQLIIQRLDSLEGLLTANAVQEANNTIEIIDREELCKRLNITEPTALRMEKKGTIPALRIGSIVRYNWFAVVSSLEKKGK